MLKKILLVVMVSGVILTPAYAIDTPSSTIKANVVTEDKSSPKINLNTAEVPVLVQSFKGIGKKRAQAIVNYRIAHGNFKSVEDLAQIQGLGKQFVSKHLVQLQQVFSVD